MTLAYFRSLVQEELHQLDIFRAETETAMEHGLIRTIDGQCVQTAISLTSQLLRYAVENGTEATVEVGRAGSRDEDPPPGLSSLGGQPRSPGSDAPTLITREDGAT